MPVLTAEHRRLGGLASAAKKKAEQAELLRLREFIANLPIKSPPEQEAELRERYTAERLTRTRKQIERLDELLEAEDDPQKIDRLASALARLSEIERQLANRPLPGSWKPTQSPRRKAWTGDTGPTPIPDTTTPSVPAQPNVISNPNPLTDNKAD